jgi:hypothetical protein
MYGEETSNRRPWIIDDSGAFVVYQSVVVLTLIYNLTQ